MLFRNSISNTKRLFQKTLESVKSFFSGSNYQKLPKIPPFKPYSCSSTTSMNSQTTHQELEQFYTDFTQRWESDKDKTKKRNNNKNKGTTNRLLSSSPTLPKQQKEDSINNGSFMHFSKASPAKNNQIQRREDTDHHKIKISSSTVHEGKGQEEDSCSKERSFLVARKLRELEMIDVSNVDHVLDIEEVLHYYSRLTCPAYLDIVDKFFLDIYAEFFRPPATPTSVNSRPKMRSLKT